jgi:hypothetical protein
MSERIRRRELARAVGYGDIVPATGWGRVVAGITFLSFLNATVVTVRIPRPKGVDREDRRATRGQRRETRALLKVDQKRG